MTRRRVSKRLLCFMMSLLLVGGSLQSNMQVVYATGSDVNIETEAEITTETVTETTTEIEEAEVPLESSPVYITEESSETEEESVKSELVIESEDETTTESITETVEETMVDMQSEEETETETETTEEATEVAIALFAPETLSEEQTAVPQFGTTTFYNFSDGSVIPKENNYGNFIETITSEDGLLTIDGKGQLYHNGGEIAVKAGNIFSIMLPGNADISFQQCYFGSGGILEVSGVPENGSVTKDSLSYKGDACKNETTLRYEGPAATLVFTVTGSGYIHGMTVKTDEEGGNEPEESKPSEKVIDVWDIGTKQETGAVYKNWITQEAWEETGLDLTASIPSATTVTFGDAQLVLHTGDILCGSIGQDASASKYSVISYPDGYTSTGVWHTNGKGGTGRRCVLLNNVEAGDRVTVYMGSHTIEEDQLHFQYMGSGEVQNDGVNVLNRSNDMIKNGGVRYDFIAKYDGQYKLYVDATTNLKPVWHRIVRVPAVKVTGNVNLGNTGVASYGMKFINNTTEEETIAKVNGTSFEAELTPGYEYTAVMTGVVGVAFTLDSKTVAVKDTAVENGMSGVTLQAEKKDVFLLSGYLKGLENYDMSKVKVILQADPASLKEDITLKIDPDFSFSEYIEPNVTYTVILNNANDYMVVNDTVCISSDVQDDIVVVEKPCYKTTGEFLKLPVEALVTSLTFTNVEDEYSYAGAVLGNGYEISLRDGAYRVEAIVDGYTTNTHVVVDGSEQERDLLFVSTGAQPTLSRVSDIYVGYPEKDNNYATVREAVAACKAMNPKSEEERITVHIAPGVYREQVIIEAPYISFVNDNPKEEVKLTWYYGVGYKYYSAGKNQYYDEERAYDKYEKNTVTKWGAATYVKSSATAFRAENITFEASFNRYITEEELADGVEVSGESTSFIRKKGVDVTTKEATERSAALALEANHAEFYNCQILGSQDTMYTGGNVVCYLRDCVIEGNTDYIFGGGNIVFDECELRFYGYKDKLAGGYITAAAEPYRYGYVMNNCTVTGNSDLMVGSGFLGRPWRQSAMVTFINTKLADSSLIAAVGWNSMSGSTPEKANYTEYNTILLDGTPVNTSNRTAGTVVTENPIPDLQVVFEDWTPVYYNLEEKPDEDESTEEPESSTEEESTEEPESITKEESSEEESTASTSTTSQTVRIEDDKTPLAETVIAEGSESINVNLAKGQSILRVKLLEKYYGRHMYVMAHLGNGIGFTIDSPDLSVIRQDIQLGASMSSVDGFADGFITYRITPVKETVLPHVFGMHMYVGNEYVGATAYIFSKDIMTGEFVRRSITTVNEIGNIAFMTSELSEVMVLIAE